MKATYENEELKKENEKLKEENKDMRDTQGFECDADVAKFFEECGRTHYGNHIEVLKKQNEKLKKESVKLMKEQYKLLDEKDCLSRVFWTKNEKLKKENEKLKKGCKDLADIMVESESMCDDWETWDEWEALKKEYYVPPNDSSDEEEEEDWVKCSHCGDPIASTLVEESIADHYICDGCYDDGIRHVE